MMPLFSLSNPTAPLIIDASAIINLVATGFSREILNSFPSQKIITDVVVAELEVGFRKGRKDLEVVRKLESEGSIKVVEIGPPAIGIFEELVSGNASMTLDDGEASTIAFALANHGIAVVDERKAIRICESRYSSLETASSVDILFHPTVRKVLVDGKLKDALINALAGARMRVLPHQLKSVCDVVGWENLAHFPSLPRSFRDKINRM